MSSITCPNTSCGATLEGTDLRHCPRCGGFLPAPEKDATDPLIGQTIMNGKYRVVSVIGEGGMGKVYLAEQKFGTATRKVAIKTLQPELAGDSQIIARFYREAQTVIELEHPNTIRFYDFGELDERKALFVVMEFIQGESLAHALLRGTMDATRTERILSQVCGSLQEAHERGIVHRDLKPDNIYLTQKGAKGDFVKVLDFGIAKRGEAVDEKEAKLTRQGMVLGTPPYMSPEQFTGQQLDNRSDVYALGIIAYEMMTGVLPFTAATPWEWATKHLTAQPIPIESQPNGARVPEMARRAIMRSMSKSREDRPASVTEFLQEFAGHSEGATDWTASSTSMSNPNAHSTSSNPNLRPNSSPQLGQPGAYTGPFAQGGMRPPQGMPTPNPFGGQAQNAQNGLAPTGMMGPPPQQSMGGGQQAPQYYQQQPNASGFVAAPSSAGFAAVPPTAPPGMAGSNPPYPGGPNPFGNPMTAGAMGSHYNSMPQPAAPRKNRTGLIIGAVIAVLAIGGGIGVALYQNHGDDPAPQTQPTQQVLTQPNNPTTGTTTTGVQTPPTPTQLVVQPIVQTPPPPPNNPNVLVPTPPPPNTNPTVPTHPTAYVPPVNPPSNPHPNVGPSNTAPSSPLVSVGMAAIDADNFPVAVGMIARVQSQGDAAGAARMRGALRTRSHRMINNLILRNNPGDCAQAQQLFRVARSANAAPPADSFGDSCRAP